MKKYEAQSIGQIIEMAIKATGNEPEYRRQRACFVWSEVVGPNINRLTTRRWISGSALHVSLASAPLANELAFNKERLIQLINQAVGSRAIDDIIFHS